LIFFLINNLKNYDSKHKLYKIIEQQKTIKDNDWKDLYDNINQDILNDAFNKHSNDFTCVP